MTVQSSRSRIENIPFTPIKSARKLTDFIFSTTPLNPYVAIICPYRVVIGMSNIKILKANHNKIGIFIVNPTVVIGMSNIKILKANHNTRGFPLNLRIVVIGMSNIKILKANHNLIGLRLSLGYVVIGMSNIKILKANHNTR